MRPRWRGKFPGWGFCDGWKQTILLFCKTASIKTKQALPRMTKKTGKPVSGQCSAPSRVLCAVLAGVLPFAMAAAHADGGSLSVSPPSLPAATLHKIESLLPQPHRMLVQSRAVLPEHAAVLAADFSPGEASYLALTTLVGEQKNLTEVHVWNVASAVMSTSLHVPAGASTLAMASGLRWAPDGTRLAACTGRSDAGVVAAVWAGKPEALSPAYEVRESGSGQCTALAFSRRGGELLVAENRDAGEGGDRLLVLDATTGLRRWGLALDDDFHAEALALSPDGHLAVIAGRQADRAERLLVVDLAAHTVVRVLTAWPDVAAVTDVGWSADGARINTLLRPRNEAAGVLTVRDAGNGTLIDSLPGSMAMAGGQDYLVTREQGSLMVRIPGQPSVELTGLGIGAIRSSGQGNYLAVADEGRVVVLQFAHAWLQQNNYVTRADLGLDGAAASDPPPATHSGWNVGGNALSNIGDGRVGLIVLGVVVVVAVVGGGVELVKHMHLGSPEGAGDNVAGFRDCQDKDARGAAVCPELIQVPAGSVVMGAPDGNRGDSTERPQHKVTLSKPLAVGRYPVTRGEYLACVADKVCKAPGNAEFKQDDTHPAVMVNYQDAQSYVGWLSQKTGKHYRLPSEAEWEYVARGGSNTAYPWGDTIGVKNSNCGDCGSKWDNFSTSPVGSFKPNGFGLYDVVGNVWQWVADCYHATYQGAPADGSVWGTTGCNLHPTRGGAWNENSEDSRLSSRRGVFAQARNYDIGIRVVRELD
jgi:formylglycine-generating enzyme required for sulfatase activity